MTKAEAIQAMKSGEKVTHRFFSDSEFITMRGVMIIDENDYKLDPTEFWRYRKSEAFNTDWEIYKLS